MTRITKISRLCVKAAMALALLPLAGCSAGGSQEPQATAMPIRLVNYDAGMSRTFSPLDQSLTFYVVAVKEAGGEQVPVMPGYTVSYAGDGWSYQDIQAGQYLKYWDLSADSYLFSAVSPTPDNSDSASEGYRNTTVEVTPEAVIRINNVMGNLSTGDYVNSSHSPEWMVAQTRRVALPLADTDMLAADTPLHDPADPLGAMTDVLPLRFRHIMAKVDFLVYANQQLILQSFRVEVTDGQPIVTRADFSTADYLTPASDGWSALSSPDADDPLTYCNYTFLDGRVISADPTSLTLLSSHAQIPQAWAATGRHLHITFQTKDGDTYEGSIVLDTLTNHTNSWDQNVHYRYILMIDTDNDDTEVILMAVDMDVWRWQEGSTHYDTQTDW